MSFLKLKTSSKPGRVLIAVSEVALVHEIVDGAVVTLKSGEEVQVQEGYQTLVNRLTKDDA